MDGWNQLSALLLLIVYADSRAETVVKTTGRGPDTTPVCSSENLGSILLVSCRISTARHRSKDCHLIYTEKYFNHECDSRFRLVNVNRTVFIHLTSLTPEDSGNYSCECSYEKGTYVLHLSITVDYEDGSFSSLKFVAVVVVVTVATTVIIAVGIMCCILKRKKSREKEPETSELRRSETLHSVIQDDIYTSLQHSTRDVYQTFSSPPRGAEADPTNMNMTQYEYFACQEMDGKDSDLSPIYETI